MTVLLRSLLRLAVSWTINTLAILALAWVVPGFSLGGPEAAITLAAVLAVLFATLRPLLVWVALPLIVLTGGLLSLVISTLFVLLAAALSENVTLTSFWSGLVVVLGLGLVNAVAGAVLPVDDDRSYFSGVTRRAGRRHDGEGVDTTPGLVMFEIDGLADPILRRAIDAGLVPTMARWLAEGSHVLTPWECDLSSQTGASQAGILHGDNTNMPGFRWFEKETGRTVVSNHPNDAAENERERPPGHGLLAGGGSAVGNMFSGEAAQSMATMSRVSDNYRTRIPSLYSYFADPQNYARALYLSIHDIALEKLAAWKQRRRDERPRVARGGVYPLTRAATTVALRELGVYLTVAEMYRGVPAIYGTFVGYDEVAHHSGPERHDAMQVLRRLDKQLARLERAARYAPRPYRIVVLSDHGQSPGTPFRQTHGETLHDLIGRLAGGEGAAGGASTEDEGIAAVNVALTETIADQARAPARVARRALGGAVKDGGVDLAARSADPDTPAHAPAAEGEQDDVVVLVSGCLGLVYFPDLPGRATRAQVDGRWPNLVAGLIGHEGISFVMVRDEVDGAVVQSAGGSHRLSGGLVEGDDPLRDFGPHAAEHLRRTDGFDNCPDLLINGRFDPEHGDVAPFEEFAGSHGGMGGAQMHPFLLHPSDLGTGDARLVGAASVNALLLAWRAQLAAGPAPTG